jgi:hypothetical protein
MMPKPTPRIVRTVESSPASPAALPLVARELNENLAALHSLLRQLLEQAEEKLAAIRAADSVRMQLCAARETDLLAEVGRVEQQRGAILARAAQGLPDSGAAPLGLGAVARRVPEPLASVFRARTLALERAARELQKKNELVARVAQHLQSHIRAIFAALAKANQESVVYSPKGQHEQRNVRFWLDAVG